MLVWGMAVVEVRGACVGYDGFRREIVDIL